MILPPLNDEVCLAAVTQRAKDAVGSPEAEALAARLGSVPALRRHLQSLPQRDDTGDPADGPRIDCGDTSQRVRLGAEDPNCCERGLWFLAVAERLDPNTPRQLATIDTPHGRHTFPVENGQAVRLEPAIPRNALAAGLHAIRNARGEGGALLRAPAAVLWLGRLAAEPARRHPQGVARWRRGSAAMHATVRGAPLVHVADVGFVLALAEPEADRFGLDGRLAFRRGLGLLRRAPLGERNLGSLASVPVRDHRTATAAVPARDHRTATAAVPARDHRTATAAVPVREHRVAHLPSPVRPAPRPAIRHTSLATFATPVATVGLAAAGVPLPVAIALAPAIAPLATSSLGGLAVLARRWAR
mgnify:CR=1 FL=1